MPNVLGTLQIIVIEKFQLIFTLCAEEKRNIENIKILCASNICRIFVESID